MTNLSNLPQILPPIPTIAGGTHTLDASSSTATITLSKNTGTFKGFLIKAGGADLTAPSNGKTMTCGGVDAVTHSSSGGKSSVTTTWTVPSTAGTYTVVGVAMTSKK